MSDELDELTNRLQESANVDPTSLGEHPRYSQYKNQTKAAEQQAQRRQDALDRHAEGRFNKLMELRNLAGCETTDEEDYDVEDEQEQEGQDDGLYSHRNRRTAKKYADQLMLSEWLVDIPESLSTEWTMVAAPIGRRVLVVASRGKTSTYNKAGRLIYQFQSKLPGGNVRGKHTYTILDCIYVDKVYYVLDILCWNEKEYAENPFDFRMYMLKSLMDESPEIGQSTKQFKYPFKNLPRCPCSVEEMERMLSQPQSFHVDGLLFYHNTVVYEPGQSPLVGWLKPWMMPEILNVKIHKEYQRNEKGQKTLEFIETYNKEHGHSSKIDRSMEH